MRVFNSLLFISILSGFACLMHAQVGDPLADCTEELGQNVAAGMMQTERHVELLHQEFYCIVLLAILDHQQSLEEDVIERRLDASGELEKAAINKAAAAALATQVSGALDAGLASFLRGLCESGNLEASGNKVTDLVEVLKYGDLAKLCNYEKSPGSSDAFCNAVMQFVATEAAKPDGISAEVPRINDVNPVETACEAIEKITLPQSSLLGASTAIGWKNAIELRRAARALVNQCALELLPLSVSFVPSAAMGPSVSLLGFMEAVAGLPPTNPFYQPLLAICQLVNALLSQQTAEYKAKLDQMEGCLVLLGVLKADLESLDISDLFTSDWIAWNEYQVAIDCLNSFKSEFLDATQASKDTYEQAVQNLAYKIKSRFVFGPDPDGCSVSELREDIRTKLENQFMDLSLGPNVILPDSLRFRRYS